jgi:hypothetical protein
MFPMVIGGTEENHKKTSVRVPSPRLRVETEDLKNGNHKSYCSAIPPDRIILNNVTPEEMKRSAPSFHRDNVA